MNPHEVAPQDFESCASAIPPHLLTQEAFSLLFIKLLSQTKYILPYATIKYKLFFEIFSIFLTVATVHPNKHLCTQQ